MAEEMHPAVAVLEGKTNAEMKQLYANGTASPYGLKPNDYHIRPQSIKGRTGVYPPAGHFTAYLDMETGRLRVDHTGETAFWLEIDLSMLVARMNE